MLQLNAIGNLTRDGVMGASSSTDVLNFAVAVNDRRTKETTYVDCALWGARAKALQQYLKRGQKVFVQGETGLKEYNGNTQITCNVAVVELLGGGGNRTSTATDTGNSNDTGSGNASADFDDEIPF
jgi:single-strand DNA-binding protein